MVKEQKRELRALRQQAELHEQKGNFRSARQIYAQLVAMDNDSAESRFAATRLQALSVDKRLVYVGLATLLLYLLAWVYAFAEHPSL